MRAVGIIAEYNPFHKGHAYHLRAALEATRADAVVVVMSGCFTQRAQPAAFFKWQRAQWALDAGADLVLELPTVYAASSAEGFAMGGVSILHRLGAVDALCFGSETEDIDLLQKTALLLAEEPPAFRERMRAHLDAGHTMARARSMAAVEAMGSPDARAVLMCPNAILAVEYLKALRRLDSGMRPFAVRRRSAGYHQKGLEHELPSATAIREYLHARGADARLSSAVPPHVYVSVKETLGEGFVPPRPEALSPMILYALRTLKKDGIAVLNEVGEGLENRIWQAASDAPSAEAVADAVKTKRYTRTRLDRILLNALLGIDKALVRALRAQGMPAYARVLGFTQKGSRLLSDIARHGGIDIVSNAADYVPADPLLKRLFDIDVLATDLYASLQPRAPFCAWGQDFTRPIIKRT